MGFLDKKKIPEQDKKFFFRQEYLTTIKYAIYQFTRGTNCYYPNIIYLEGEEGSGKTWIFNQVSLFAKDKNIAPSVLDVRFDSNKVVLSEVLSVINFLVQLRNSIVEKEQQLAQAFVKFDEAYNHFLQGTLTDEQVLEKVPFENINPPKENALPDREEARQNAFSKTNDAKSKLASMRSKGSPSRTPPPAQPSKTPPLNPQLNPNSLHRELFPQKPEEKKLPLRPEDKKQINALKLTSSQVSSAYVPLNNMAERELPRTKSGKADVKAIARNLTNAVDSLKKGNVKTVDFKSILFKKFLQAFDIVCANRKLVLLIDDFDYLFPLHNFFFNIFLKNVRSEFLLILASPIDMERELKEKFETSICYIYLQNFSIIEIQEYLEKQNLISDPKIAESIIELTNALPIGISLVAAAFTNFKGDAFRMMQLLDSPEEEYKSMRYVNVIMLDHLPQHDRKIIILLSMVRRVDFELIENIAGVFNTSKLIQSLSEKYSFVEETGLPEMIKTFTRTYAKHEAQSLYEEIYKRAFEFYSDKLDNDPKNKEYIIDSLYYHFRVDEDSAYKDLLSIISVYISNDVIFCQDLIHGISSVGISKETRNRLNDLKESLPYVILKDYKKTLTLLTAISELQKSTPTMNILDSF